MNGNANSNVFDRQVSQLLGCRHQRFAGGQTSFHHPWSVDRVHAAADQTFNSSRCEPGSPRRHHDDRIVASLLQRARRAHHDPDHGIA